MHMDGALASSLPSTRRNRTMALVTAADSPSPMPPGSQANPGSVDPGRAAALDHNLWRLILQAGSPTAALEPILRSSSVRVQLQALEHLNSRCALRLRRH